MEKTIQIILRYLYTKQFFILMTLRTLFWSKVFKKFGKGSFIFGRVTILYPENVSMGNYSAIDEGVIINARAPVDIDDHVHLSPGVVLTAGSVRLDQNYPGREKVLKPIKIGFGSWIATQSVILPGVTIGKHAVISANSLVNKDVPDFAVVTGTPAKIIGYLRDDHDKKS